MAPYPFILILCRAKEAMSDEPDLQGARAPASPPIIFLRHRRSNTKPQIG